MSSEPSVGPRLGARLRALRKAAGLTQTQLGERAGGIAPGELSRFETGHRLPNLETLRSLGEALGLTLHDMLDLNRPPEDALPPELLTRLKRLNGLSPVVAQRAVRVIDALLQRHGTLG